MIGINCIWSVATLIYNELLLLSHILIEKNELRVFTGVFLPTIKTDISAVRDGNHEERLFGNWRVTTQFTNNEARSYKFSNGRSQPKQS